VPTGDSFRARFKYPYIIIHRIDLHNVMLDACSRDPLVTLVPDAMVSRFTDHGDRVTSSPRSFHFPLQPLRPHDARANSSTKVRCCVVGLRSFHFLCIHLDPMTRTRARARITYSSWTALALEQD
jgi:hypothetical protein